MKAIRCLFDAKHFDFALQFRSSSVVFPSASLHLRM